MSRPLLFGRGARMDRQWARRRVAPAVYARGFRFFFRRAARLAGTVRDFALRPHFKCYGPVFPVSLLHKIEQAGLKTKIVFTSLYVSFYR